MKALTEILPDVFVVEVEADSFGFDIQNYTTKQELIYMIQLPDELDEILVTVKLPLAKDWQILGTITKDEISFDVEPYVERGGLRYLDYSVNPVMMTPDVYSKQESFRSLLLKHGLFWDNPIKQPLRTNFRIKELSFSEEFNLFKNAHNDWQQHEAVKLTGKLVVLKKVTP